jgi:hypothetical protein
MNTKYSTALLLSSALLVACGSDNKKSGSAQNTLQIAGKTITVPETYNFPSSLDLSAESSVSYTGQTARNTMLADITVLIKSDDLANSDAVKADLITAFGADTSLDDVNHGQTSKGDLPTIPGPTYGDISGDKTIVGKVAGNDKCVGVNGQLYGQTEGIDSTVSTAFLATAAANDGKCKFTTGAKGDAQQLIEYYFDQVAALKDSPASIITAGGGDDLPIYIDAQGRDYQQLAQKFISVAMAFNQGANDYLVDAPTAKLTEDKEGKPYSSAEHKWDEAFGYFGAARDYATNYSDLQIAGKEKDSEGNTINQYNDTNGDGSIDLRSEINTGHSVNCAKRDLADLGTNFTEEAFTAFVEGRALIGELTRLTAENEDFSESEAEIIAAIETRANTAAITWEKCIAATVVHYINDVNDDIAAVEGSQFASTDAFKTYAKHWSELKGFALGLQYNPSSPINDGKLQDYKDAMALIGDAPAMPDSGSTLNDYADTLIEARDLFQGIYGFTDEQAAGW